MNNVICIFIYIGLGLLSFCYYYNIIISIFSINPYIRKVPYENYPDIQTFDVMIPCHNEEQVILDTLKCIYDCTYDRRKYMVHVIADNCTDKTVAICQLFQTIRSDFNMDIIEVNGGSKPKSINLALQKIGCYGDNIVFIDADNKVSSNMFNAFNYYHIKRNPILQGRIASDNHSSVVSKGFKSAFSNMRYSFQIARNQIGLSGSLCGTCFSINKKVFDEVGFDRCDSLVEDLEFSIMAILKGYSIKYIDDIYVLNQNVDDFKASVKQRIRWNSGHAYVSCKLSKDILKEFFKNPSLQLFDSFMFLNSPSRSLLYILILLLSPFYVYFVSPVFAMVNLITLLYQFGFILYTNDWDIRFVIPHVLYSLTMIILLPIGWFKRNTKTWVKTTHVKISK